MTHSCSISHRSHTVIYWTWILSHWPLLLAFTQCSLPQSVKVRRHSVRHSPKTPYSITHFVNQYLQVLLSVSLKQSPHWVLHLTRPSTSVVSQNSHINKLWKSSYYHIRSSLLDICLSLGTALIHSRLDYCNSVLCGALASNLNNFKWFKMLLPELSLVPLYQSLHLTFYPTCTGSQFANE